MPETKNQTPLYSDLDEVLNKPPKKLVRYGNIILLLVITLVVASSFFVQHSDVVTCAAIITQENSSQIKTPSFASIVQKVFITKDTLLSKGDTLLHVKPHTSDTVANDIFVVAPFNCWVSVKRIIEINEQLPPLTSLFDITGSQTIYTVKLDIAEGAAAKVKPGMLVKLVPEKIYTNCSAAFCKVISTPYEDSLSKKTVAEARLIFTQQKKSTRAAYCYIFNLQPWQVLLQVAKALLLP